MKYFRIIFLSLSPLLLTVSAVTQVTDWKALQSLSPGTKIHVTLKRGPNFGHCFFDVATEEELVCTHRAGLYSRQATYARNNVKAVYRAHNSVAIGIGVGASAGAVIGATRSTCCHVANAMLSAGALGLMGGFVGLVADPFVHGHAVYRNPTTAQAPTRPPVVKQDQDIDQPDKKIPCLRDGVTRRCVTVRETSIESAQSNPESTTSER